MAKNFIRFFLEKRQDVDRQPMGFRHPCRVHRLCPLRCRHHPADHRMGNYSLISVRGIFFPHRRKSCERKKHRDQDHREI
jgi:hypothetical protein